MQNFVLAMSSIRVSSHFIPTRTKATKLVSSPVPVLAFRDSVKVSDHTEMSTVRRSLRTQQAIRMIRINCTGSVDLAGSEVLIGGITGGTGVYEGAAGTVKLFGAFTANENLPVEVCVRN